MTSIWSAIRGVGVGETAGETAGATDKIEETPKKIEFVRVEARMLGGSQRANAFTWEFDLENDASSDEALGRARVFAKDLIGDGTGVWNQGNTFVNRSNIAWVTVDVRTRRQAAQPLRPRKDQDERE